MVLDGFGMVWKGLGGVGTDGKGALQTITTPFSRGPILLNLQVDTLRWGLLPPTRALSGKHCMIRPLVAPFSRPVL